MADNEELTRILAGAEARPSFLDQIRAYFADPMRAAAAKPQSQLLKEFAIQALMQAPMGLGSRGGAMRGNDYVTAAKIENRLFNHPTGGDEGVTGGRMLMSTGENWPMMNSAERLQQHYPSIVRNPFADDAPQSPGRPANEPYPFKIIPGGKK